MRGRSFDAVGRRLIRVAAGSTSPEQLLNAAGLSGPLSSTAEQWAIMFLSVTPDSFLTVEPNVA